MLYNALMLRILQQCIPYRLRDFIVMRGSIVLRGSIVKRPCLIKRKLPIFGSYTDRDFQPVMQSASVIKRYERVTSAGVMLRIGGRYLVRKDRYMDRHDRSTTFDSESHSASTTAHQYGSAPGNAVKTAQVIIDQPDQLIESDIPLLFIHIDFAPNGITLISCGISTSASSTYSVDFEIRDAPNDGSPTAVETVATSGSLEAEDDGTLSATAVAVSEYVYAKLPATDVDQVGIWITYTID
jgi:hypothetical protein